MPVGAQTVIATIRAIVGAYRISMPLVNYEEEVAGFPGGYLLLRQNEGELLDHIEEALNDYEATFPVYAPSAHELLVAPG